jgi:hypothetical protein
MITEQRYGTQILRPVFFLDSEPSVHARDKSSPFFRFAHADCVHDSDHLPKLAAGIIAGLTVATPTTGFSGRF